MDGDVENVLIDRHAIERRVGELAERIAADLRRDAGEDAAMRVTLVAVLTGSLIFLADLIRRLPMLLRIRLVTVSSYPDQSMESRGAALAGQLPTNLVGQHVLLVDDILDSGGTIRLVQQLIEAQQPASIRTCVLLRKQVPSALAVPVDYVGFEIGDVFVVGYGLDYDGFYRNLPDVVTLKQQVLKQRTSS